MELTLVEKLEAIRKDRGGWSLRCMEEKEFYILDILDIGVGNMRFSGKNLEIVVEKAYRAIDVMNDDWTDDDLENQI